MSPTITYLEFQAIGGDPVKVKIYAIGGIEDGIVMEDDAPQQVIDSESDESGRWRAGFISLPAGNYQLIAFTGSSVVADERYTVTADTVGGIIQPWSEARPLTVAEIVAGVSVTVTPSVAYGLQRAVGNSIALYNQETQTIAITVLDSNLDAVNLSGKTLAVYIETMDRVNVATVASGSITIGGPGNNVVSFAAPSAVTAAERKLSYSIRDASAPKAVYAKGIIAIDYAPAAAP
jgi:hypothetical protein